MEQVLLVVHLIVAVALVAVVMVQRPSSDGGGLMGGGNTMGGLFTARGSANLLTRTTGILAAVFIGMSLLLSYLAAQQHGAHSLADTLAPTATEQPKEQSAPAETTPAVPEVPVSK
jgi:preprotein translocase subunit SecG